MPYPNKSGDGINDDGGGDESEVIDRRVRQLSLVPV
jgi:hypothetical protein